MLFGVVLITCCMSIVSSFVVWSVLTINDAVGMLQCVDERMLLPMSSIFLFLKYRKSNNGNGAWLGQVTMHQCLVAPMIVVVLAAHTLQPLYQVVPAIFG